MFYIRKQSAIKKNELFPSSKQKRKSALRGIGLHSVEAIAKHVQGYAEFYVQDLEYHAKVPCLSYSHLANRLD